jgi:hypothetical protein
LILASWAPDHPLKNINAPKTVSGTWWLSSFLAEIIAGRWNIGSDWMDYVETLLLFCACMFDQRDV